MMEFTVVVDMGDVYVNDTFVRQLCFDPESIGYAVTAYLNGDIDDSDGSENHRNDVIDIDMPKPGNVMDGIQLDFNVDDIPLNTGVRRIKEGE